MNSKSDDDVMSQKTDQDFFTVRNKLINGNK